MTSTSYSPLEIQRLRPLLRSIAAELLEREQLLEALESRCQGLGESAPDLDERRRLTAEMAGHRRELRHARQELKRLGCTVYAHRPLALRVPARLRGQVFDLVWTAADLAREDRIGPARPSPGGGGLAPAPVATTREAG